MRRRAFPESVQPFLRQHPWREMLRQLAQRLGYDALRRWNDIHTVAAAFDRSVAESVLAAKGLGAVYAYMDTAEQTFLAAKRRGIRTIYELPTPYWRFTREIVLEEARLHPDWSMTLPVLEESDVVMQRRDRELQLADIVVVPSDLVRDSLRLAPAFRGELNVVPYGCPESVYTSKFDVHRYKGGRLRVLYVGSLNQGKGLAYLAAAMNGMNEKASLTVIGSRTSTSRCAELDRFLAVHRHCSGLSNEEVLAEMFEHDVLVLPTLYEGLAIVLLEAMACGLAVITTPNSGLAGIIRDGFEAFLVPLRSSSAIRDCLLQLASNPDQLIAKRQLAQRWSREHTWRHYRDKLLQVVSQLTKE